MTATSTVSTASSGPGGSADQVVPLIELRGARSGGGVLVSGRGEVTAQLVEVGPDRVPLVPLAQRVSHALALGKASRCALDVADGNGPVEDGGRIISVRVA